MSVASRFARIGPAAAAAALAGAAHSQLVVGGFDQTRGDNLAISIRNGDLASLRNSIAGAFPGTTFTGAAVLTAAYLGTIDVLLISSAAGSDTAITPLTQAEKDAVAAFIAAGGRAIIATDNDSFAGESSDPANESLVDAFGFDCFGTGPAWAALAVVPDASLSPVTNGPFGAVSSFNVGWTGWFNGLPAGAISLGYLSDASKSVLAVLPFGSTGPGSGAVVFLADSTFLVNGFYEGNGATLVLNAIAYLENASCLGDLNDNGIVDGDDLGSLLGQWGACPGCDADFNNDRVVDGDDLGTLLGAWGDCG